MTSLTHSEENYLKAIYRLSEGKKTLVTTSYRLSEGKKTLVTTSEIANVLCTSAASVTDMIQRLHAKQFLCYQKYQGVQLTEQGKKLAIKITRKHFLWEVFLVEKLKFGSSEIHAIAEQLEHIQSDVLIERLEHFLGNPQYSPHGMAIPNSNGETLAKPSMLLSEAKEGESGIVCTIKDDSADFLQYLYKRNIYLGVKLTVAEKVQFDESMDILIDHQNRMNVSRKITDRILIRT
ncbi:MAG TPA: metal-dependent transcriptional regulator [Amoebophilaceae bacterium]|jgi:DtxR family Mn-dependent transcriptional regulator|nr:metal-dependent transcriptional regulator [Amoebophilaceae bacterium]